jgi:LemA protein
MVVGMAWLALVLALGLVVVVSGWGITTYHRLVEQRGQVQAAGAKIDEQLTRRHDLILHLVQVVHSYAPQERAMLEAVVAARHQAAMCNAGSRARQAAAEDALTQALARVFAVAEAYPHLRTDQTFRAVQAELLAAEDKIAYSQQFLNSAVQTLNASVESIPSNLVAALGGFRRAEYFRAADADRGAVQVRF